jgi:hypothetical protein
MSLLFVLTTLHLLLLVRVRSAGKNTLRQTENEKLGSLHKDRHQPEPEDQKVLSVRILNLHRPSNLPSCVHSRIHKT